MDDPTSTERVRLDAIAAVQDYGIAVGIFGENSPEARSAAKVAREAGHAHFDLVEAQSQPGR